MDQRHVIAIIFFVIIVPVQTFWGVLLWLRRNIHPIKGREAELITIGHIFVVLYTIALCIQELTYKTIPCGIQYLFSALLPTFAATVYAFRTLTLYIRHGLTIERLALTSDWNSSSIPLSHGWFTRHRYMLTQRTQVMFVCGLLVFLCVTPLFSLIIDGPNAYSSVEDSCPFDARRFVSMSIMILSAVLLILMSFRLVSVFDNYGIRHELRGCSIVVFLTVISLPFQKSVSASRSDNINSWMITQIIAGLGIMIFSALYPLYRSYKNPDVGYFDSIDDELDTLEKILSSTHGINAFKKFLVKEFAVENLLFYIAVGDYESGYHKRATAENGQLAHKIFAQFIHEQGVNQVNINHDINTYIEQNLAKAERNLFTTAKNSVFRLMSSDSFTRFISSSPIYLDFVNQTKTVNETMFNSKNAIINSRHDVDPYLSSEDVSDVRVLKKESISMI